MFYITRSADGGESPVSYAIWTDNRDVVPPSDGNWENYTPSNSAFREFFGDKSVFDGKLDVAGCELGQTGIRNQNIYSSRLTQGIHVVSPTNAKATNEGQRTFVILIQNQTAFERYFDLTIRRQPEQGTASFVQFDLSQYCDPNDPYIICPDFPLTSIRVGLAPFSSAGRTLFVDSFVEEFAAVEVDVQEFDQTGNVILGGLRRTVLLNPDPTNPRLMNPRLMNPEISNPRLMNAVLPDGLTLDDINWENAVTDITWGY